MREFPGKVDCTRSTPHLRSRAAHILLPFIFLCGFCAGARPQTSALPQYPEVAWLGQSSYCNPYFGIRLTLPSEFKSGPLYLPVQPLEHHMLLAQRFQRLDSTADLLISAMQNGSGDPDPALLAAKARVLDAHRQGLFTHGPKELSIQQHKLYSVRIANLAGGQETSYYLTLRGYIVHIAVLSQEPNLLARLNSAVEHLEFLDTEQSACTAATPTVMPPATPAAMAAPPTASSIAPQPASSSASQPAAPEPAQLYYGPALPTALVAATVSQSPGRTVPTGQFSQRVFVDPELGLRVLLPPDWHPQSDDRADQIIELMRAPIDPESDDLRRALFRACSRVLFTADGPAAALDPQPEIPGLRPALAVLAMPQGCVPDMVPPATPEDSATNLNLFANSALHSLGVPLLNHGSFYRASPNASDDRRPVFELDGALPYQLPGETLYRRLSLRVLIKPSGPWLIFVYSVAPSSAAQRELASHITIGTPQSIPAK